MGEVGKEGVLRICEAVSLELAYRICLRYHKVCASNEIDVTEQLQVVEMIDSDLLAVSS